MRIHFKYIVTPLLIIGSGGILNKALEDNVSSLVFLIIYFTLQVIILTIVKFLSWIDKPQDNQQDEFPADYSDDSTLETYDNLQALNIPQHEFNSMTQQERWDYFERNYK